jgi:2-polyprenyl-6-hydroxyphenyl methylase/3-demethylubiquinone-9 3-methyltransferase
LYQVYDTSIPRVKQYLDAEIHFIQRQLTGTENVIEIGAGYGRILKELGPYAKHLLGIEISDGSVKFGREYLKDFANIRLEKMDVHKIDFIEEFDAVLCLQNALSAVKGDALNTIHRCMRALIKGGKGYFSTYSHKFWEHRLAWFKEQADKKLLGELDSQRTKDGVIVCKDGFQAITFSERELRGFGDASGYSYEIQEVDESSLFLIILKNSANIELER